MELDKYKKKKIALFGKPRAFDFETLRTILARYDITLLSQYEKGVVLVVEGAVMPTPMQLKAEELYENAEVDFCSLEAFEKAAAKMIEPKTTLMHLKLAAHKEKIVSYLKNDYIDDTLFLQILPLHRFESENFFDNDTNRDITAALVRRFYKAYERNHNIQYSYIGLLGVVEQSDDPLLLETIFRLEPVQKALPNPNDPNAKLLELYAIHPVSTPQILQKILKSRNPDLILSVSKRTRLDAQTQHTLLSQNDPEVERHLAASRELEKSTVQTLLERGFGETLAASLELDEELFEMLFEYPAVARNETLTPKMQRTLFENPPYRENLAKNPACILTKELLDLHDDTIRSLVYRHQKVPAADISIEGFEESLAANPFTPSSILETIYAKNIHEANEALAANPSTPVEILYQLSFDMRYAKSVKSNPAFAQHIKTLHAIGV